MADRPSLRLRRWYWRDQKGKTTPGIGLLAGEQQIKAHLTAAEARKMADKLHDMADDLERPHPKERQTRG